MDDKWRIISCPCCTNGMYWSYTYDEPADCRNCEGSGRLYIRPTGHLFQYPGGPAAGMWDKEKYENAIPVMPFFLHDWDHATEEVDSWPIGEDGDLLPSQQISCMCGQIETFKTFINHRNKMEQEWIESHKSNLPVAQRT